MSMDITSPAFAPDSPIPTRFTGDGEDVSPPLEWAGLPDGTVELSLIVDDPDAPGAEPWVHWVLYRIPAASSGLAEGLSGDAGALEAAGGPGEGANDFGRVGYGGPAPPRGHGVHHYQFKLYALDMALDLAGGVTKKELLEAMSGHVLGQGLLVGTYER
jgi:Raf kinase inhibitor-like YbhB/YbcL family protein